LALPPRVPSSIINGKEGREAALDPYCGAGLFAEVPRCERWGRFRSRARLVRNPAFRLPAKVIRRPWLG